ncbi:uncharacterized protein [Panulirus ornatus]|uniref:uncharacterized protein isoform X2 n=1 Tax=Panulirus ornatus TaxID=150431 RepID=UPI003A87E6F1
MLISTRCRPALPVPYASPERLWSALTYPGVSRCNYASPRVALYPCPPQEPSVLFNGVSPTPVNHCPHNQLCHARQPTQARGKRSSGLTIEHNMSSDENLEVNEDLPEDEMTEEQRHPEPPASTTTTTNSNSTNTTTANTTSVTTATTTTATTTTTTASATTSSVSVAVGTEDLHSNDNPKPDGDTQAQPSTSRMSPDSEAAPAATKNLRTCRVCGDRAKSMHFGGLSCDSCKAFFRRAVHNDAYVNFTCPYDGNCVINIASRKCCQFCRYKKCTSIGMERSWVMSEEDRAQMMKQRAEKKAKMDDNNRRGFKEGKRELVPFEPDPATMLDHMTAEERDEIERAVLRYRRAYNDVPYRHDLKNCSVDRPSIQIINMFTTIVRRFAYFARLFPEFCDLPSQDQGNLLRGGILEMSLIRGVQSFDTEHSRWPDTNHQLYRDAPTLCVEDMKKLVSCELYEMHMKFIHSLKELNVDEPVMMLLLLIVLFTSDRPDLAAAATVQQRQDHYLHLLRKYLGWRYGPHNAPILYPRLLIKLTDLRELNDQHTEYNLKLAKQEIAEIQMQLSRLKLNPYTEWPTILQHQTGSSTPPTAPPQEEPGPSSAPSGVSSSSEVPVQIAVTPATPTPVEGGQVNLSGMLGSLGASGDLAGPFNSGMSGLLALLDFEQLASNPSFQRIIMQQFQKSIMNVLSSPNFGLGNLFPDGRIVQQQQQQQQQTVSSDQQQDPSPIPQQPPQPQATAPPQFLLQQQKVQQQPHGPPGQVPVPSQGVPQGYPASDLMTQLDYLDASHPSNLQNVQQSQQAFQQLEHQLMSNISDYGSFGEQGHHHQLLQHQYHYHLQQQQHLQQQALFHQHQQQMHHPQLQEGQQPMHQQHIVGGPPLLIPKEEPMTPSPPNMHAPHPQVEHPLLYDEPQSMMHQPRHQHSPPLRSSPTPSQHHHQQSSPQDDDPRPRRNSLTDFSGLTQFRNMLEEFATLNNPDHLQQVKQILGPDLVASLQQKLVASETSLQSHQQYPLSQQETPPPPPPPPQHFPSQSHVYSPTASYQFFSGREYQRQVAGSDVSSSSYCPDTHGPSASLQYGPADTSSFCRSQHRVTPPALGVATISPPPAAPFPVTDTPPVVYQYPPDLVHNVTSAT